MEAAHGRLGNACLLLSRAAGALEAACAEYEAAQQPVKRWWVIARLLFWRTVRGRLRADPTDPSSSPSQHRRYQAPRPRMRISGPRALTRARRRSARACLGACPRAVRFSAARSSRFQTLITCDLVSLAFLALSIRLVSFVAGSSWSSRSDTSRACSATKGRCWTCARP